jgi:hypothetical protein
MIDRVGIFNMNFLFYEHLSSCIMVSGLPDLLPVHCIRKLDVVTFSQQTGELFDG